MHEVVGLDISELAQESGELLPGRATMAVFELGRWIFNPSFSPSFSTIGSPWSNMTNLAPSTQISSTGSLLPVNIAITPSFTVVIPIVVGFLPIF